MRNMWHLFLYDVRNLGKNVVSVMLVLGLVFLPSIFTWYNVIACWDVFGHTGNLKVAVANVDEGYESNLVALRVNVGDQVVSALRANDELEWVFTDEEDAIDGARSGKYYAAVVIPASFSRDMMSFYSPDTEHAKIVYYENEKKNAVAPRVINQGADQVATQINQAFIQALSDVALSLASSIGNYVAAGDEGGRIAALSSSIAQQGESASDVADLLRTYAQFTQSAQGLVESSTALLGDARGAVGELSDAAAGGAAGAQDAAAALGEAVAGLSEALKQAGAAFSEVPDAIDSTFASVDTLAGGSAAALRNQSTIVEGHAQSYREVVKELVPVVENLPSEYQPAAQAILTQMKSTIELLHELSVGLSDAADGIESGNANAQEQHAELRARAEQAAQSIASLEGSYAENLKPQLDELALTVSEALQTLQDRTVLLGNVSGELQGSATSVAERLATAQCRLNAAADDMDTLAEKLATFSARINEALATGEPEALKAILGSDVETLARALSAPVGVETHEVFAADNFGSAMTPLYVSLALWVGSLLMMVLLNPVPSQRAREHLQNPRSWQLFFGRYGVIALLSFIQSTVLCLGMLLFLRVQVAEPLLFFACFWIAGLVFSFVIYTLVSLFANLGKALAVLLLIVQVSGGGGSYPLQLLPEFFQAVSPFLPATHVVNALRAAMMGVYDGDFWINMGLLLAFVVPCAALGLLRPALSKPAERFAKMAEESKLIS